MTTKSTRDQTFRSLNAKLETTEAPYDPISGTGDPQDSAVYLVRPGVEVIRPWLAIRNGPAFQWPLGMEGFTISIDPTLGIHKFVGDNAVTVDVIHRGQENITLSGNFPGNSAPAQIRALRDVVYQGAPTEGKILFLPEIMRFAQRVQVVNSTFSRDIDSRGRDATYSIEFVRLGQLNAISANVLPGIQIPLVVSGQTALSSRSVSVDAKHNTLRKIANWKLGTAEKWRTVFDANQFYFIKNGVPLAKVPDYRLPTGLKVYY